MQITIRVANAGNGKAQKSYVGPLVRVGRNPDAEICFHDGSNEIVSWDHAIIELRPSGAFLQDQGSSNGTFLNDRQLERRTQLNVRDTIRLGTSGPRIIIEAIQSNPTPASEARELGDATPAPPVGAPATSRVDEPTRERRSLTDLRLWQMTGQRSELTVVIVGLLVLLACAVMAIALRNGQSPSTVHVETTSATAPAQPGPTAIAARSPIELDVSTVPRSEELSEIRDLLHEVLEERKTSKEPLKSRERLLKYALQQRTAEKEHAGGERDEAIRSIERIQLVNEARNYVLGSFNAANTGQVSEFTELSHRLKRLRHVQEQWTNKFVTLPEDSLGQVWSGKALNHFLQLCGGVALRHKFLRERLEEEETALKRLLDAPDLSEDDRLQLTQQMNGVIARVSVLNDLTGLPVLNDTDRTNLNLQLGSSEEALSLDETGTPRTIHWNVFFTLPDSSFQEIRERFDPLYRSFIDDFKGTGTPDLDKGSELLRVVEELDEEFQEYRERYGHGGLAGERKAVYTAQLYRAKAMIERIRIGVVAMMTAESAGQVFIGEAFEGTTVEELMAYAANNSFTFTPANQLERATYEKVYREMVRYYLTLHGVARAIEQDKQRIAPLTEQEHELMDIEYENSLEDLHGIYATSRAPVAFTAFVSDVSSEWFVGDVADDFWDWYKRR